MTKGFKVALIIAMGLMVLAASALIGWNVLAGSLSNSYYRQVRRDPETRVVEGAEARWLGPEDAPGAVLFVHGFIGSPNHFADLPDKVAAQGWRVRVMLLPGHGTDPRDFDQVGPSELVRAVEKELQTLHSRHAKVVLVGHSMGGALATIVASETGLADGLVLAAPYFAVKRQWWHVLAPETWLDWGSPVLHWIYASPADQPVRRKEVSTQIVSYQWFTTRSARTAKFLAKQASSPDLLSHQVAPTLLLHGLKDSVTDPEASRSALQKMICNYKRHITLQHSDHCVFWDYDRERVARETLAFLEEIIKNTTPPKT